MILVLTTKQVCERFQICSRTLYRWRKTDPTFPKPVFKSRNSIKFDARQVLQWYEKQLKLASQTDIGA